VRRDEVLDIFRKCGAFLQGHFLLSSGLHSSGYLQCALVCQRPDLCARLCRNLADRFRDVRVDVVVGPALGGIVLAYELARALGARGIFMERDERDRLTLRRGFCLSPGERVLVAEDVMTTGGSAAAVAEQVESAGAEVVGVACLVDRGGARHLAGRRVESVVQLELPTFPPDDCPLCREGRPLAKPGSRKKPGHGRNASAPDSRRRP